jgi:hypothetical protein
MYQKTEVVKTTCARTDAAEVRVLMMAHVGRSFTLYGALTRDVLFSRFDPDRLLAALRYLEVKGHCWLFHIPPDDFLIALDLAKAFQESIYLQTLKTGGVS